jgi:sec-independent protein translocase protein TatA
MPSGWEWAILVLIALLLIGGSRLPGIGRDAGRAVRTVREKVTSRGDGADAEPLLAEQPATEPAQTPPSPPEPERS